MTPTRMWTLAFSAVLLLGAVAPPAHAGWGDDERRRDDRRDNRDERRRDGHDWNGGYYRAPPVIYDRYDRGREGYYPPPVIYSPGINVTIPGINIDIR